MFPVAPKRDADADVLAVTGMDTLELVSRLQRFDLDQATIDGLRIMADRLCSEYPFMPGDQVSVEGRSWLRRIVSFQGQRLTLSQHREVLTLAAWKLAQRVRASKPPASQRGHPARRARGESVGTHRGPRERTSRARQRARLLEAMPYPDNLDHHFVVDPTRFDFHMKLLPASR